MKTMCVSGSARACCTRARSRGSRCDFAAQRRARVAVRLTRDLELNTPGVALALDLLDEIHELRSQLARSGTR